MNYKVFLERKAQKQLDDVDPDVHKRIKEKLVKLKEGFSPRLDIKKLKGYKQYYRLRVGKYRVLFELQKNHTIVVFAVLPRKKAYK